MDDLIVKLKRKLEYREHVHFEPLRPSLILRTLQFLRKNPLYCDIDMNLSNNPDYLIQPMVNKTSH